MVGKILLKSSTFANNRLFGHYRTHMTFLDIVSDYHWIDIALCNSKPYHALIGIIIVDTYALGRVL